MKSAPMGIALTSDGVLKIGEIRRSVSCSVCNRECKPPPTPKFETEVIRSRIRIFGLISIRMSVEYPFQNREYIRRRHSFRQVWFKSAVDCVRTEKTEKC